MKNICSVFISIGALLFPLLSSAMLIAASTGANTDHKSTGRLIKVDMVAMQSMVMNNRLGAHNLCGQFYALKRDVVPMSLSVSQEQQGVVQEYSDSDLLQGARLRLRKRPRPIVLRANVGDTLEIHLTNLMPASWPAKCDVGKSKPGSDHNDDGDLLDVGVQIMGLEWLNKDNGARTPPGESAVYRFKATGEGVYMMYSPNGYSFGNSQLDYGLFGAVNVQPEHAEYYRSQVTAEDLKAATYRVDTTLMAEWLTTDNASVCDSFLTTEQTGLPGDVSIRRQRVDNGNGLSCPSSAPDALWELRIPTLESGKTAMVSSVLINEQGYLNTQSSQPVINYKAMYPAGHSRENSPVVNMLVHDTQTDTYELAHSDLTGIITGPGAGRFPYYVDSPNFIENPATPDRRQPYREFTIAYHIAPKTTQAFDVFNDGSPLEKTLAAGSDGFAVNYGIAGIAAEIYANRINVGPQGINKDGVDLLFEEFFLSAWALGDPAVLVDTPANNKSGKRATKALYPDDPSNVYHSYMRDHVKFRVLNAGSVAPHVHHQHAHQWLHTPNSSDSHYLDSQMINPGSTYTLEMTYNGSGNRNQTVGDSIFHCHIYPHFAQGMWAMWRVHDVFEEGTKLDADGKPAPGSRALPDGEIVTGTPIPGLVPMPGLAMAPVPAVAYLIDNGRRVEVKQDDVAADGTPVFRNPGFPFFIPGVAGHRAPHPPLDFAWRENPDKTPRRLSAEEASELPLKEEGDIAYLDGGLPRSVVLGGEVEREFHTRWDFTKEVETMEAMQLPETGTALEVAAMDAHATRTHKSHLPNGLPGNFILNGLPPSPGAPFAAPEVDDDGNSTFNKRRYQAAVIQTDVVFNKQGWHYPQQRFITLLDDVKDTVEGERPPEPFFFRAETGETVEFWHTNLVPNYYELDDFQVRTPTDILGQHIHLVKFDVTSSDGAGNGFNYEDGTFSPAEVRERIEAINKHGGLYTFDNKSQFKSDTQVRLKVSDYREDYGDRLGSPPANQDWNGAQTTIQRFGTDPLLNNQGEDRTLRTVFTHDHFGPSTHQQVGLYGAMLVEPSGTDWFDAVTGIEFPSADRDDGGPTSWQALIEGHDSKDSFREFAIAMGDLQLAYKPESRSKPQKPTGLWFSIPVDELAAEIDKNIAAIEEVESDVIEYLVQHLDVEEVLQEVDSEVMANVLAYLHKKDALQEVDAGVVEYMVSREGLQDVESELVEHLIAYMFNIDVPQALQDIFAKFGSIIPDSARLEMIRLGVWQITLRENHPDAYTLNLRHRDGHFHLDVTTNTVAPSWADNSHAIWPPEGAKNSQTVVYKPKADDTVAPDNYAPFPTIISDPGGSGNIGIWVNNYRNEPLDSRLQAESATASPHATDPSFATSSIARGDDVLNTQPAAGAPISEGSAFAFPKRPLLPEGPDAVGGTDPYTPMMRAYANDNIEVRAIVGAVDSIHSFGIQGVNWNAEPSYANSGFRDMQGMGISEHFEMLFKLPPAAGTQKGPVDRLYSPSNSSMGLNKGAWGILRTYNSQVASLASLSNNPAQQMAATDIYTLPDDMPQPDRVFKIAVSMYDKELKNNNGKAGTAKRLQYQVTEQCFKGVCTRVNNGADGVPLVLRAAAGEWIEIVLTNQLNSPNVASDFASKWSDKGNNASSKAVTAISGSTHVGLNPRLISYDSSQSSGLNVGINAIQTVAPGETRSYLWYAGNISLDANNNRVLTPVEFGGVNLTPSDPVLQASYGLIGALIVEPQGASWDPSENHSFSATITDKSGDTFTEVVVLGAATASSTNVEPGSEIRLRVLNPSAGGAGTVDDSVNVITVEGHNWREEPYLQESTVIGNNIYSQTMGTQQVTSLEGYNLLIESAGGEQKVPGAYHFYNYPNGPLSKSELGTLCVQPQDKLCAQSEVR